MPEQRLLIEHLELKPLPARAAAALPGDRDAASRALGCALCEGWPDPNVIGVIRRQAEASPGGERYGVWVMIEGRSGDAVGDIGFHGPPDGAGTIEVGYNVISEYRRRGYATEAATALVEWARAQPGVREIVAGCDPGNVGSIRTLERVGFRRTGETKGEIRWRLGGDTTLLGTTSGGASWQSQRVP